MKIFNNFHLGSTRPKNENKFTLMQSTILALTQNCSERCCEYTHTLWVSTYKDETDPGGGIMLFLFVLKYNPSVTLSMYRKFLLVF